MGGLAINAVGYRCAVASGRPVFNDEKPVKQHRDLGEACSNLAVGRPRGKLLAQLLDLVPELAPQLRNDRADAVSRVLQLAIDDALDSALDTRAQSRPSS